ncbi:hypothetical protein EON65_42715 [archaeon]|nr:MAG: hypothetical protein EON65_42715 [archaeon]
MVISTCRSCKKRHLIADNEKKLDFGKDYGQKIEDYLLQNGEKVQKFYLSKQQLDDYYLVDQDGELTLVPKATEEVRGTHNVLWALLISLSTLFLLCIFIGSA